MTFDSQEQRRIMGLFATGVTVVSTQHEQQTWGMTANAVTSLSLDPPLLLVAVQKESQTHAQLKAAGCFAVNILTADQEELSNRFAFKGPKDFSGLDFTTDVTGSPIIPDTLGYVDCQLKEILPGGDHDIFIGEIVGGGGTGEGTPLLYYQGQYKQLDLSDEST